MRKNVKYLHRYISTYPIIYIYSNKDYFEDELTGLIGFTVCLSVSLAGSLRLPSESFQFPHLESGSPASVDNVKPLGLGGSLLRQDNFLLNREKLQPGEIEPAITGPGEPDRNIYLTNSKEEIL